MRGISAAISTPTGAVKFDAELRILGEPLNIHAEVLDAPASLADIVPLARQIADEVSRRSARSAQGGGLSVPCSKGCAACCRYLVPLSAPELLRLERDLSALPAEPRRVVLVRLRRARQRIIEAGPPALSADDGTSAAEAASAWYAALDMDCPFLDNKSCAIYDQRPIACRQHMAACSPQLCRGHQPGQGRCVATPLDVCQGLAMLAAEMTETPLESVMLPLAPNWLANASDAARRRWPGPLLMERFLNILHRLVA